ncbi:MAG: hypothetical protein IPG66_06450 [Hydrogenophilales bacterium]|nr:hypothetical protein [Hydrogenophilales bacterium]
MSGNKNNVNIYYDGNIKSVPKWTALLCFILYALQAIAPGMAQSASSSSSSGASLCPSLHPGSSSGSSASSSSSSSSGAGPLPYTGVCSTADVYNLCGAATNAPSVFPPTTNLCSNGGSGYGVTPSASACYQWACYTYLQNASSSGSTVDKQSFCATDGGTIPGTPGGKGIAVPSYYGWDVDKGNSQGFIPLSSIATPPPSGLVFPYGILDFKLIRRPFNGDTWAAITIVYPAALPTNLTYWKYGPTPEGYNCTGSDCLQPHWYPLPACQVQVNGNQITLTISDGGVGDDDLQANGVIQDQGGPAVPLGNTPTGANPVPTLSYWAITALTGLLVFITFLGLRTRVNS